MGGNISQIQPSEHALKPHPAGTLEQRPIRRPGSGKFAGKAGKNRGKA
jgi:hypothetical protein